MTALNHPTNRLEDAIAVIHPLVHFAKAIFDEAPSHFRSIWINAQHFLRAPKRIAEAEQYLRYEDPETPDIRLGAVRVCTEVLRCLITQVKAFSLGVLEDLEVQ